MGFYWSDKQDLSINEISDLRNGSFGTSLYQITSSTAIPDKKKFYNLGDKMYSQICITNSDCKSQFGDAFPIPQPNIYGMCNNYASASFMKSETNECTQIVDLVSECESTLNPEFYSSKIKVFAGQSDSSDLIPVTINNVYRLSKIAGSSSLVEYVLLTNKSVPATKLTGPASATDSTYTCSNVLKEIAYTVQVS